jgi:hypothetical protein
LEIEFLNDDEIEALREILIPAKLLAKVWMQCDGDRAPKIAPVLQANVKFPSGAALATPKGLGKNGMELPSNGAA